MTLWAEIMVFYAPKGEHTKDGALISAYWPCSSLVIDRTVFLFWSYCRADEEKVLQPAIATTFQ